MADLLYQRSSGHVKLNGAVLGRIEEDDAVCVYSAFSFAGFELTADTLPELLKRVRSHMEGKG